MARPDEIRLAGTRYLQPHPPDPGIPAAQPAAHPGQGPPAHLLFPWLPTARRELRRRSHDPIRPGRQNMRMQPGPAVQDGTTGRSRRQAGGLTSPSPARWSGPPPMAAATRSTPTRTRPEAGGLDVCGRSCLAPHVPLARFLSAVLAASSATTREPDMVGPCAL